MNYHLTDIARIVGGNIAGGAADIVITSVCTDSRRLSSPQGTLFAALAGAHNDGHKYIPALCKMGVTAFLVNQALLPELSRICQNFDAAFVAVEDTLDALQALAGHHRRQFACPVAGITGSNGKTIVKEWAAQLLLPQLPLVRSPKSYNSQIGVPLSVLQMTPAAALAIFEAGISLPHEMERLQRIICPSIALITNLGEAHQEGFASRSQKLSVKLKLCASADVVVCCADHTEICEAVRASASFASKNIITWGSNPAALLHIENCAPAPCGTAVTLAVRPSIFEKTARARPNDASALRFDLLVPFTDAASLENAMHAFALCYALWLHCPRLGIDIGEAARGLAGLAPVVMRLDVRKGIGGSVIVNDAYSADVGSLRIALDFLASCAQDAPRAAILSDFEQSGRESWRLYSEIAALLRQRDVSLLIGIGAEIERQGAFFECPKEFYASADDFLQKYDLLALQGQAILIKGSRSFGLERISQQLEQHTHITTLDVNLTALSDNLNALRRILKPSVKTLILLKANAYGAGLCETARFLQQQRVDYFGVAFADEGIALRRAGITLPILALNPEAGTFDQMAAHRLEPEIYSFAVLQKFNEAVRRAGEFDYPIHIKLDTGMHRLGFLPHETDELVRQLRLVRGNLRVAGIFSHLAAADEPQHDAFTLGQIALFDRWSGEICAALGCSPLRHIANSWGAVRQPAAVQMDMARVGAALYGITANADGRFRSVCTLKSALVQIKIVPQGESVGYGCRFTARRDTPIGIIPVGYADGLDRRLGNGVGRVLINGRYASIVGNVCMDMCMVNLEGIAACEGDEAVFFGDAPSIESIAEQLGTIAYETLARVPPRVKRVYFNE